MKSPPVFTSPAVGVPSSSLLFRSCRTQIHSILRREVWQMMLFLWTVTGKRKEGKRHKPFGVCANTFHTHLQPRTRLSLAYFSLVTRVGQEGVLPPCGSALQLQLENHCRSELALHEAGRAVNIPGPQTNVPGQSTAPQKTADLPDANFSRCIVLAPLQRKPSD